MFELDTVATFVAGLSISGVTVLDYSDLTASMAGRDGPTLYPNVAADVVVQNLTRDTVGGGTVALQTLEYGIPYRLLYAELGTERDLSDVIPGEITVMKAIFTALVQNDTPVLGGSSVDLKIDNVRLGGTVADLAARPFHGVDFVLRVMEFIN